MWEIVSVIIWLLFITILQLTSLALLLLTTLYYNYSLRDYAFFCPIFYFISSFEPILCGILYTPSPPVQVGDQSTLLYQVRYIFHRSLGNFRVFISKYIFNLKKKIKRDMADIEPLINMFVVEWNARTNWVSYRHIGNEEVFR